MTDRALTVTLRSIISAAVLAIGLALLDIAVRGDSDVETLIALVPIAFGVVVWLASASQPHNRTLWALALFVLGFGAVALWGVVGGWLAPDARADDVGFEVADLSTPLVWMQGAAVALATAGLWSLLTFGLLLFPNGHLPSHRWRWVAWFVGVIGAYQVLDVFTTAVGFPLIDEDSPWGAIGLLFIAAPFVCLASLFVRYRSSGASDRSRIKWVLWGASVFVPLTLLGLIEEMDLLTLLGLLCFAAAYGIAIVRYNLFDIDVVINRSIVFGLLAVFITAVYAVVVGTLGSLIGGSDVVLAIAATAIVAILFEPVRNRIQRLANRMVYGTRTAPYEVLSELTRSLPRAEEEAGLLDRMATQLRAGTGADRAQVWLTTNGGLTLAASDPVAAGTQIRELGDLDGVVVPIEHGGATLGALTVEPPTGVPLRPAELRLADDLAGSAALVVRKLRLDTDLEHTAAALASSRRRLLNAQDTELRRLERQLQEGAIQDILGLKVAIALAARTARAEGSDRTADLLTGLADETQRAIDEIHSLATGLYPALLEAEGLDSAVRAMAATAPVPVTVTGTTPRLDRGIEVAAFYTITEATTNAIKHATPPITITLHHTGSQLTFTVADSGPGFDPTTDHDGSGLLNMTDRLDTIAGTLTITATPGNSTTITGVIPTPDLPADVTDRPDDQPRAAASESGPKSDFETKATAPASSAGPS